MFVHYQLLERPRRPTAPTPCAAPAGPSFSNEEIRRLLDGRGIRYQFYAEEAALLKATAEAMVAGQVVGWFHGRMEFGPRALGARSIIGDARNETMQATMNLRIKFRESFRPFAPCVLEEDVSRYFELDRPSPYMLLVADVRRNSAASSPPTGRLMKDPDLRKRVNVPRSSFPAITHVDSRRACRPWTRRATAGTTG